MVKYKLLTSALWKEEGDGEEGDEGSDRSDRLPIPANPATISVITATPNFEPAVPRIAAVRPTSVVAAVTVTVDVAASAGAVSLQNKPRLAKNTLFFMP